MAAQPHKKNKNYVDFKAMEHHELKTLAEVWYVEARKFEAKLDYYMTNRHNEDSEYDVGKLNKLWFVGKKLWRRIHALERWRRTKEKQ